MEQILESLSVVFISPFADTTAGLLWCVYVAVIAAFLYTVVRRGKTKRILLALKSAGAVSLETAKTKKELGIAMPDEKSLRAERLICVEENEDGEAVYFFPPDREEKAKALLKAGTTRPLPTVLGIVGLYALLVLAYHTIPLILDGFSAL